ncbi:hypothetical protein SV7mr_25190 [Stieleria bergensis]|uniref:Uncharacterized protein n=1 Tax=Stieleria bergensis TaxID=2528025 RepID=A0A517SV50_9BACT|nr:hypothetical protein SV7mr_25190 [Planctomycetes bacterium SV_7m_r]
MAEPILYRWNANQQAIFRFSPTATTKKVFSHSAAPRPAKIFRGLFCCRGTFASPIQQQPSATATPPPATQPTLVPWVVVGHTSGVPDSERACTHQSSRRALTLHAPMHISVGTRKHTPCESKRAHPRRRIPIRERDTASFAFRINSGSVTEALTSSNEAVETCNKRWDIPSNALSPRQHFATPSSARPFKPSRRSKHVLDTQMKQGSPLSLRISSTSELSSGLVKSTQRPRSRMKAVAGDGER